MRNITSFKFSVSLNVLNRRLSIVAIYQEDNLNKNKYHTIISFKYPKDYNNTDLGKICDSIRLKETIKDAVKLKLRLNSDECAEICKIAYRLNTALHHSYRFYRGLSKSRNKEFKTTQKRYNELLNMHYKTVYLHFPEQLSLFD